MLVSEKIKPLNKHIAVCERHFEWDGKKNTTRKVIPNPAEFVKQLVLMKAKRKPLVALPYTIDTGDGEPWALWYMALTDDNPPEKVKFSGRYEEFREEVERVDFTKYDDELAKDIRAKFRVAGAIVEDVDTDSIEQGMLEDD